MGSYSQRITTRRGKEMTATIIENVIAYWDEGESVEDIAALLGLDEDVVQCIIEDPSNYLMGVQILEMHRKERNLRRKICTSI